MSDNQNKRKFGPSIWALNNKNTIFLVIIALAVFGLIAYNNLPKELFPEINYPTIFVQTIYPGNSAADIENLITNPLEKELKGLNKLKDVKSTSGQDVSIIFVEFNPDVKAKDVLQDVKDAVDKSKSNLPNDLKIDPIVTELDFSNFPIITLNLSGKYNVDELKIYADRMKDEIEKIAEVSKVNIKGISEKEIQINVDIDKMQQLGLTFNNIENAVKFENMTISAGDLVLGDYRKTVRIVGEYKDIEQIKNIVVKVANGNPIFLKDVAEVKETYSDPETYARLGENPVVSLQIIKKNGENLISAVENVISTVNSMKENKQIPENLSIAITNNQATNIKSMISNLESNIISGILIVVFVLFLFLGLRNSIIVGISIPMSFLMTFVYLKLTGQTVNMMTLFSLVLALGMLVDNAIVVVEVITRKLESGEPLKMAAKDGVSEIAVPIITSTMTTLAAFVPLLFWHDITGEFMRLLPMTLIVVLTASLINALFFAPVLSQLLIKPIEQIKKPSKKKTVIYSSSIAGFAILLYLLKINVLANLLMVFAILYMLYTFILFDLSDWFQEKFLVWLESFYAKFISFSLKGKNPQRIMVGAFLFLFATMIFYFGIIKPKVLFFPNNEPKYLNIYAELPINADINFTDSVFRNIEKDINKFMEPYKEIIESQLSTVGAGITMNRGISPFKTFNKAQLTINFVDYEHRQKLNTSKISQELMILLKNKYPGVNIYSQKNQMGPPTGEPINMEVTGENFDKLLEISDEIINKINNSNIKGIEKLTMDVIPNKPEIIITIDKQKAGLYGLTSSQIAMAIRTAVFGSEASKYKVEDDEYPIMIRADIQSRNNLSKLLNMTMQVRNNMGQTVNLPIYSVANITYDNSFDAIKHIDSKRTITISSNVIEGYNAAQINKQITQLLKNYKVPAGYKLSLTGEQKSMKDSMEFMSIALVIAIALIMIILVLQFNSFIKPIIILTTVVLSTIGVFGGYGTFGMDFTVMMTGVGIIALAGTVVNNAIVLVDYIDYLKKIRKQELEMDEEENLPMSENMQCIIKAGQTRLRPVLLTAITTVLGLFTMAIGMNFNYGTLLSDFNPQLYFGGDNVGFWGPLSWAVIFGLSFATLLTLIVLPAMYLLGNKLKLRIFDKEKLYL